VYTRGHEDRTSVSFVFRRFASAAGQSLPDLSMAAINADLSQLRSLPRGDPLPDLTTIGPENHLALKQHVMESNPQQHQIMQRFSWDIARVHRQGHRRSLESGVCTYDRAFRQGAFGGRAHFIGGPDSGCFRRGLYVPGARMFPRVLGRVSRRSDAGSG